MVLNQTQQSYSKWMNSVTSFVRWDALPKLATGIVLALILWSCLPGELGSSVTWKTYQNERYGFEFPYPSDWIASAPPSNRDGQAFRQRQNPAVEIRGWASHQLPVDVAKGQESASPNQIQPLQANFTTEQGLEGLLQVDIGEEMSSMTLTLEYRDIRYNWQGRSPSEDFSDYYRFFQYVASRYRVVARSPQSSNRAERVYE